MAPTGVRGVKDASGHRGVLRARDAIELLDRRNQQARRRACARRVVLKVEDPRPEGPARRPVLAVGEAGELVAVPHVLADVEEPHPRPRLREVVDR
eukprot:3132539-Alexandrium_andersonii.AAC.1